MWIFITEILVICPWPNIRNEEDILQDFLAGASELPENLLAYVFRDLNILLISYYIGRMAQLFRRETNYFDPPRIVFIDVGSIPGQGKIINMNHSNHPSPQCVTVQYCSIYM